MRVDLGILIGSEHLRWASKTIELDFAPVRGMRFSDGAWKRGEPRPIIDVSIEFDQGESTYLAVALEPDASETRDILKPIYEANGWKVTGP